MSSSFPVPVSEGLFATDPPAFSEGEVLALARVQFGLSGTLQPLAAERDQNFALRTPDGRGFVLKIANAAEDPAVVDFQARALLHVAARDPGCPVPRLWPARNGAPAVTMFGPDGVPHTVWMQSLLPGVAMAEGPRSGAQRREAGAALARLGAALADFRHPAARHYLVWDLRHAADLRPLVGAIDDGETRRRVSAVLERFTAELRPALEMLRTQVVHNDLNPSNILVDPADPDRITGLFDFGDLVETELVNDVAVAAAYQVASEGDPLDGVAEFLAGYAGRRPLAEAEARLLPDLVAVRMAMTLTVASWRAVRYPANRAYLLRNTAVAASGLARLEAGDPDAARDRLAAVAAAAGSLP